MHYHSNPLKLCLHLFRIKIFLHAPIHVHVSSGDAEAKFCIDPEIALVENNGLKPREVRQAMMAIEENKEVIIERWNEYFEQ